MTGTLLHVTTGAQWAAALASGASTSSTRGRSLDDLGYVHCFTPQQLPDVLRRHWQGVTEPLVLLEVDPSRLDVPVTWEEGEEGERFPHVHGPLPVSAVVAADRLPFAGRDERVLAVVRFWRERRGEGAVPDVPYEAWSFGVTPSEADELVELVLHGPKRATAALVAEFESESAPLPAFGGHSVVLDGAGRPRCVLRTTDVRTGPLVSVDDSFAWDEGEGDRSRDWWLAAHRRYVDRVSTALAVPGGDEAPMVFERFELVWPTDSPGLRA